MPAGPVISTKRALGIRASIERSTAATPLDGLRLGVRRLSNQNNAIATRIMSAPVATDQAVRREATGEGVRGARSAEASRPGNGWGSTEFCPFSSGLSGIG